MQQLTMFNVTYRRWSWSTDDKTVMVAANTLEQAQTRVRRWLNKNNDRGAVIDSIQKMTDYKVIVDGAR